VVDYSNKKAHESIKLNLPHEETTPYRQIFGERSETSLLDEIGIGLVGDNDF